MSESKAFVRAACPPSLLTRSHPCGHPDPFRSVRDLGRFPVRCSRQSGFPRSCSSGWLPGTASSRIRRPPLRSSEFVRSACPDSIAHSPLGQDHSAYIPDHGNCPVTARTLQGMARVRSGQALAWPLVPDRSVRRGSRIKHDFAYVHQAISACARCPAVTVMLEAEGADTYAQRGIPGSEPSQGLCTFPVYVVGRVVIIAAGVRVLRGKWGLGCPQAGPRSAARYARAG